MYGSTHLSVLLGEVATSTWSNLSSVLSALVLLALPAGYNQSTLCSTLCLLA